jgi:aspartate/glutamate/glutamine transport system permease protein
MTALVSALALSLALILGVLLGILGTSRFKAVKAIIRVYIEFLQNTPLVIQVFFLYNALPYIGLVLPVLAVGVLGVGCYHSAYIAEIIRAGIGAVPKGQKEAASAQGIGYWQSMRHVVLPQASKIILPPLANQAVFLVKNTSVMAIVAGGDLMYHADSWASETLYYGPAYVVTGLLYLAICLPLSRVVRNLELRQGAKA